MACILNRFSYRVALSHHPIPNSHPHPTSLSPARHPHIRGGLFPLPSLPPSHQVIGPFLFFLINIYYGRLLSHIRFYYTCPFSFTPCICIINSPSSSLPLHISFLFFFSLSVSSPLLPLTPFALYSTYTVNISTLRNHLLRSYILFSLSVVPMPLRVPTTCLSRSPSAYQYVPYSLP